jgi:hypothetical protein
MGRSMIDVPFEPTEKFYNYLRNDLKLSNRKAFQIIYYLQEFFDWEDEDGNKHYGILPDTFEKCRKCGDLFDTDNSGCLAMLCDDCRDKCCPEDDDTECADCRLYKRLNGE